MKKLIALTSAIALVATLALSGGCATSANGKRVISLQKAQDIAPALAASVSGAVIYGYSKDKNTVFYANIVKVCLQNFLLADNLQPAALQAALMTLPVAELKTPEAQLVMTPVLAAYQVFADQRVKAGLADNEGLRVLIQAMIDGIDAAQNAIGQMAANQ